MRLSVSSSAARSLSAIPLPVHLEVEVRHRFEVERADAAHDDHARGVGEEVDRVVVGEELRDAQEDRGRLRIVAMRLERHHARPLREAERLVHHPEQLEMVLLARAVLEEVAEAPDEALQQRAAAR